MHALCDIERSGSGALVQYNKTKKTKSLFAYFSFSWEATNTSWGGDTHLFLGEGREKFPIFFFFKMTGGNPNLKLSPNFFGGEGGSNTKLGGFMVASGQGVDIMWPKGFFLWLTLLKS